MHSILSVRNLTKIFPGSSSLFNKAGKDFVAIDSISFSIEPATVVGILGPNGAGKTTTLKMLLDLLTPTSGIIEYFGKNLQHERSAILQQVAFASTYTKLPERLSVQENLEVYGRLYSIEITELRKRISYYLSLLGMQDRAHQRTGSLSAGQTTRIMLTKAFLVHPKILLLDEPTAALDPDVAQDVRSFITQQQKELGLTVLLTSHNMKEVADICDRVIVLSQGKIIDDSTPEALVKSVGSARLSLIVLDGLKRIIAHATAHTIPFNVHERTIELLIDEHVIASLLSTYAAMNISYSHISIAKPTLEDYFIEIARRTGKNVGVAHGI